jgi:hypothetical protein
MRLPHLSNAATQHLTIALEPLPKSSRSICQYHTLLSSHVVCIVTSQSLNLILFYISLITIVDMARKTPSYARPTTSSLWRSFEYLMLLLLHPNKTHARTSILSYDVIKAANSRKPCQFGALPAELRLIIYTYCLPQDLVKVDSYGRLRLPSPWVSLSSVCRLVRTESVYEVCTRARFQYDMISVEC